MTSSRNIFLGSLEHLSSKIVARIDRKSTRLNSSHQIISYAVFCLKKKKKSHSRGAGNRLTEDGASPKVNTLPSYSEIDASTRECTVDQHPHPHVHLVTTSLAPLG